MITLTAYLSDGTTKDLTANTGNYSLSDHIDQLSAELKFDLTANPLDANFKDLWVPVGTKISFTHDKINLFQGIITKYDRNSLANFAYTANDYAYYLNKSEIIIQFNNVTTTQAIEQLCSENGIAIGSICDIPTIVNKIYNGSKISDVIKDLLKMAEADQKVHYYMEMREGKLWILKYSDLYIQPTDTLVKNIISEFSSSYSMEDMTNKVVVISSKEKNTQIQATAEDTDSQQIYGTVQKVEKVDDKKASQAQSIADGILSDKGKIKKSFSVMELGDDTVRAGRLLKFNYPEINLEGVFLVKASTHNDSGLKHTMRLELEV